MQLAARFERALGDPFDPSHALSFRAALELDEAEAFPEPLVDACIRWGLLRQFVPGDAGGELRSLETSLQLLRCVARRDVTAAVALGQAFVGASAVWISGSKVQKRQVAAVLGEGQLATLALTEQAHGSDVLASEMTATADGGSFVLDGEKWLVNDATRARALTVFARTDPSGGLNGFTLFLVDKRALEPSSFEHLPKKRTHGIRGADISGIRFTRARLPEGSALGSVGSGLDVVLKARQVTRTGSAAFSLGAADTCLRLALRFALERKLYGATAFDIPHARAVLTDAYVDLLCADAVASAATRLLHVAPEQAGLSSAVAKCFIPVTLERAIRDVAAVLGAHHYLREGQAAAFQKFLRDAAVASLLDGSTPLSLDALGLQLPRVLSGRPGASEREARSVLVRTFDVSEPLPPFEPDRLQPVSAGRDDVVQHFAESAEHFGHLGRAWLDVARELAADVAALGSARRTPESLELARRYALLWAAAACAHRYRFGLREGAWAASCLERLLCEIRPRLRRNHRDEATDQMLRLYRQNESFALAPVRLA